MKRIEEARISKEILDAYHKKFSDHIESDVIIVGAGPSGLIAATYLSQEKFKVAVIEKRLSPGGGIWGGGMAMNNIVVQDEAISLLDELEIRHHATQGGLHTVDAMELASGLCYRALRAGAAIFNVMTAEDVCIHDERVTGVVVNRSLVFENLPVDPLMMTARAVVDATGHEAALVQFLRKRRMLDAAQNRGEFVEGVFECNTGRAVCRRQSHRVISRFMGIRHEFMCSVRWSADGADFRWDAAFR